jgi:tRNA (guanine37-N1)-methyltransferase
MSLKEELNGLIPDKMIDKISGSFDLIGDIAILSLNPDHSHYKKHVVDAIFSRHRNVRTVLNKITKLEGDHRLAHFEILAGDSTVTIHREFGHLYKLDVTKVFFNSRLGFERRRIYEKAVPGENVIVPFCGVGPFAIPAAIKGCKVYAVEKNKEACRWLIESVRLNNAEKNMNVINSDAFLIPLIFKIKFDRAIIPTPYWMDDILKAILPSIKKGGNIHFYTFKKQYEINGLLEEYKNMGLETLSYRKCGNVAPFVSRWAFDLKKAE